MPWYIVLLLFLLAPVYAIVVRDRLWPKIANSWSTRSRSKTEARITKLEQQLTDIEHLPLLTEFEDFGRFDRASFHADIVSACDSNITLSHHFRSAFLFVGGCVPRTYDVFASSRMHRFEPWDGQPIGHI